jgi:hypothetical protein
MGCQALPLARAALPHTPGFNVDLSFFRVQKLTKEDGLPTDSLTKVTRLADGFVLVQGLSGPPVRFDGVRFHPVECQGIELEKARHAAPASDVAIWLGTAEGLYRCMDGRATQIPNLQGPDLRLHGIFRARDPNALWVGIAGRLCKVTTTAPYNQQCFPMMRRALAIGETLDGKVLVGTPEGLHERIEGEIRPHKERSLAGALIWAIHVDKAGRALIGTRGLGLAIIEGEAIRYVGRAQGLQNDIVRGITESAGSIWLATAGGGIFRWQGQTIDSITVVDGLSSNTITSVEGDDQGVVWATTAGGGLNRIWPSAFAPMVPPLQAATPEQAALTGFSYSIHKDRRDRLWIGGNQGLTQWVGNKLQPMGSPGPAQHGAVMGIVPEEGDHLLLATRRGLARYRPDVKEGSRFELLTGDQYLRGLRLAPASDGSIWIGTDGKIQKFRQGKLTPVLDLPGAPIFVYHLLEDAELGLLIATSKGAFQWQAGRLLPFGKAGVRSSSFCVTASAFTWPATQLRCTSVGNSLR